MPSMRSELSAPDSCSALGSGPGIASGETLLAALLTAVQAPLVLLALGLPWTDLTGAAAALLTGLLVASLAALGARAARRPGRRWLHMVIYMLIFGNLGMLAGAWLDFGSHALVGLTHWCHMHPGLAPAEVIAKLAGAPWSYGLMLAGCNAGMLLSDRLWCGAGHAAGACAPSRASPLRCYGACNLGMLAGMLLAEGLMPGGHHHHHIASAGVLAMLGIMAGGMTAGMLLGWWLSIGDPRKSS